MRKGFMDDCCEKKIISAHPDHAGDLSKLHRVQGQLNGVEKMINDGRYCPDILTQIRAAHSALRNIEASILRRHLDHCVRLAFRSKNKKVMDEKIDEVARLVTGSFK